MKTLLTVGVLLLVACKHAEPNPDRPEREEAKEAAAPSEPKANSKKASPPVSPRGAEPITTSRTTKQMFKTDGLKKLQATLDKRLDSVASKNEKIEKEKKDARAATDKSGSESDKEKKEIQIEKDKQKVALQPVESVEQSGELDGPTQESLRAFQRSERMPETGLPDYETLRRLGIKPDEVYQSDPPAERHGVQ